MLLQPLSTQTNNDISGIVSITEAKSKLSSLVAWANNNDDAVVIQSRGNPQALIIPYTYRGDIEKLIEKKRRNEAIDLLYQVAAEVGEKNKNLSEKDAQKLADRFVREVINNMVKEKSIIFKN